MRIHELLQPLFLYPLACSLAFLRWFCLGLRPIGQHYVRDGIQTFGYLRLFDACPVIIHGTIPFRLDGVKTVAPQ